MRVLTADVGGTKVAIGLFVDGQLCRETAFETERGNGGRSVLEKLVAAFEKMGERPDLVGLSTIGISRRGHATVSSANIPGWAELCVLETIEERLGCEVKALNDVKAAALGEGVVGAGRGWRNVLFVNLGTGIACASVIDGRVWMGAHGAAGEVGFWMVNPDDTLDARAEIMPLEEACGGRGLETAWSQSLHRPVRATEIAHSPEPDHQRAWETAVAKLSMATTNMAIAFDPEILIVGGGMARDERLFSAICSKIGAGCLFPPRVVRGELGNRAGLWGAYVWATTANCEELIHSPSAP